MIVSAHNTFKLYDKMQAGSTHSKLGSMNMVFLSYLVSLCKQAA
jgi:hypothetical protein